MITKISQKKNIVVMCFLYGNGIGLLNLARNAKYAAVIWKKITIFKTSIIIRLLKVIDWLKTLAIAGLWKVNIKFKATAIKLWKIKQHLKKSQELKKNCLN